MKALDVSLYIFNYYSKNKIEINIFELEYLLKIMQEYYYKIKKEKLFNEKISIINGFVYIKEIYWEFRDYGYSDLSNISKYSKITYDEKRKRVVFSKVFFDDIQYKTEDICIFNYILNKYKNFKFKDYINELDKQE